mmetsp:Transcript_55094/g.144917  ORF Transcript_55094/g.144917 Transcript_55094/m.144917 type:complete len:295 (-) Transcript_55094:116-1000(-)
MPYPTPGFVVRQTFLEFEEPSDGQWDGQPLRSSFGRAFSDSNLFGRANPPSQFGSDQLRQYWLASSRAEEEGKEGRPSSVEGRPRHSRSASRASPAEPLEDRRTTLVLEGLPQEYTRVLLEETLASEGFADGFDFVFLPMDLRTRTGYGHAFVNFVAHSVAVEAMRYFNGFAAWREDGKEVKDDRPCDAHWNEFCQGTDELVERYRNSPVMHEAVPEIYKPALFEGGLPVAFPAPTKRIRMPRLRGKLAKVHSSEKQPSGDCSPSAVKAGRAPEPLDDVWFVDLVASRVCGQAS